MMGFAWGVGGLTVMGVGWWGDQVGLSTALSVSVMATALVAAVAVLFPAPRCDPACLGVWETG